MECDTQSKQTQKRSRSSIGNSTTNDTDDLERVIITGYGKQYQDPVTRRRRNISQSSFLSSISQKNPCPFNPCNIVKSQMIEVITNKSSELERLKMYSEEYTNLTNIVHNMLRYSKQIVKELKERPVREDEQYQADQTSATIGKSISISHGNRGISRSGGASNKNVCNDGNRVKNDNLTSLLNNIQSQSAEEENIVQTKRTKRVRKEETDQQKKTAAETKERNKREKNIKKHTSILKKIKKSFETVFSAVTEVSQCLTKKVEIIPLLVALYNKQKAIDKREKDFYDKAETYKIIQKKSKTLWRNRACPNNQVFEDDDICLQALSRIVHWAAEVTREATASGQKRITESMQASNVLEHTQKEEQNSYNNCLKSFNDCAKKISISEHFKNFDYRSSFVSSK